MDRWASRWMPIAVVLAFAATVGSAQAQRVAIPPVPARGVLPHLGDGLPVLVDLRDVGFPNEQVAIGWNLVEFLVRSSTGPDPAAASLPQHFDPERPYAAYEPSDPTTLGFAGQCSLAQPQFCARVQALFGISSPSTGARDPIRSGGSRGFGRRAFVWHEEPTPPGCLPKRPGRAAIASARPAKRSGRCPRR